MNSDIISKAQLITGNIRGKDGKGPDKMPPRYPFKVCHELRVVAKSMAAMFYDGVQTYSAPKDGGLMPWEKHRLDSFRRYWKSERLYVGWCWPLFVKPARQTMAMQLSDPMISQQQKDTISDILVRQWNEDEFSEPVLQAMMANGIETLEYARG